MGDNKENFCSACFAGFFAMAGAGAAGASTTMIDRKKDRKKKRILFWLGITVTVISILVALYFLFRNCEKCSKNSG